MMSPQAPVPAYFAVFFQGLLGEFLFFNLRSYVLSCFLLAILGLLESGFQRILVLTIVAGNDLWKAINDFFNGLTQQKSFTNYSAWIAGGYIAIHLIFGLLVGWWASRLPERITRWNVEKKYFVTISSTTIPTRISNRRRRLKRGLFVAWLLLIVLYVQSYFQIGEAILPSHISLKILLRSIIIILGWVFLVSPLLTRYLHNWLKQKQSRWQKEIKEILELLPATSALLEKCWKQSVIQTGIKRLRLFGKMAIVNAIAPLQFEKSGGADVYILTDHVQTGKTTSLMQWAKQDNNVQGILTPIVHGKRVFNNIQTGEQFAMEAGDEDEIIAVGRFMFSRNSFDRAIEVIRKNIQGGDWLVIDEIGPLELKNEGFSKVLEEVLAQRNGKLLLVVREGLVDKVKEHFNISSARMISIDDLAQLPSEKVVFSPHPV